MMWVHVYFGEAVPRPPLKSFTGHVGVADVSTQAAMAMVVMVVVATASARGVPPKRRHVITSTNGSRFFSWKLLILLCVSLSCLVVLASLFSLHSSYLSNADSSNHFKVTRSTVSRTFHGPPKIAFLFLVRQNIPLDFLWHVFFKNGNVAKFSIYVHSAPGFVLDESTTRSSFFYGTQISNVIQVPHPSPLFPILAFPIGGLQIYKLLSFRLLMLDVDNLPPRCSYQLSLVGDGGASI
ncbi:hypothetical protein AHAS_Ahas10G0012200 [Arachis hypogaea]